MAIQDLFRTQRREGGRTAVAPRPSRSQRVGLSRHSPLDILMNRGPQPFAGPGLVPMLAQGGFNVLGAGVETVAEAASAVQTDAPRSESAMAREGDESGFEGGVGLTDIGNTLGDLLFGTRPFGAPDAAPTGTPLGPDPITPAVREEAALRAGDTAVQGLEDLDALAAENLTPEGQAAVQRIRQQYELQQADLINQQRELTLQGINQDKFFKSMLQEKYPKGVIPGASPEAVSQLNDLLDVAVEGGDAGTANNLDALIDSIMESNLSESEKVDRLGFVMDEAAARKELQGAIDQLVIDRRTVESILASPDAELLGDPSLFASPQLNVDVQFDPLGRAQVALVDEIEPILEAQFGEVIPPNVLNAFTNAEGSGIIDLVAAGQLDPNSDQFANLMTTAAPGVDITQMQSAINQGLQVTQIRNEAFDTALDQTQYEAGSIQLVYALFQAALGAGLDAQTAGQVAEDRNIHKIIDTMSAGRVGVTGAGGRAGLGMLSPEAYDRVGMPDAVGDPTAELVALIMYMLEAGGNPAVRMNTFFETGVWGN